MTSFASLNGYLNEIIVIVQCEVSLAISLLDYV